MALQDFELRVVDQLKLEGYTDNQIIEHIGAQRSGRTSHVSTARSNKSTLLSEQEGRFADVGEDIKTTLSETGESLRQRRDDIVAAKNLPGQIAAQSRREGSSFLKSIGTGFLAMPEAAITAGANVIGGAFDVVGAPVMAAGRAALSQGEEEALGEKVGEVVAPIGEKIEER